MFFWSVPAMKESFRRNSSQNFELTHPPLPHASWLHVTCRIVKRLKYRVLSKKWTENKAKVVLISVFLLFQTKMWRILTSAEQRRIRGKQPWTALKQLCFRKKQRWNSSDSALIFCSENFQFFPYFSFFFRSIIEPPLILCHFHFPGNWYYVFFSLIVPTK